MLLRAFLLIYIFIILGPLLPEHLDIGNIPVRQMNDLTLELSGKLNYASQLLSRSNLRIIDVDG